MRGHTKPSPSPMARTPSMTAKTPRRPFWVSGATVVLGGADGTARTSVVTRPSRRAPPRRLARRRGRPREASVSARGTGA